MRMRVVWRRALPGLCGLGLLVWAGVVVTQRAAVREHLTARAVGARDRLQSAVGEVRGALAAQAKSAGEIPYLRSALLANVDGETLVDLFESEDWWQPFRDLGLVVARDERLLLHMNVDAALARAVLEDRRSEVDLVTRTGPAFVARIEFAGEGPSSFALFLVAPIGKAMLETWGAQIGGEVLLVDRGGARWARSALEAEIARSGKPEGAWVDEEWRFAAAALAPAPALTLWAVIAASPGGVPAPWRVFVPGFVGLGLLVIPLLDSAFTRRRRAGVAAPVVGVGVSRLVRPTSSLSAPRELLADAGTHFGNEPIAFGRYTLLGLLGSGGMADAFLAELRGAEGFRRQLVVKRLKPQLALTPAAVAQFIDEAKLGSQLVHANIAAVLDFGKVGEGYFLAQELVVGRNLAELLAAQRVRGDAPLSPRLACYIAHEALNGLAHAHERTGPDGSPLNIVHRDVSPSNIMLSHEGEVKVIDFGIAKAETRVTRTDGGLVKGNAGYMSPEQARGQEVDARSDLFAVGLVLYELFTGAPFYDGQSGGEILYKAATGPTADHLRNLRGLPASLADFLVPALALHPESRIGSARQFAAILAPHGAGAKAELAAYMRALFGPDVDRPRCVEPAGGAAAQSRA